MKSGAMAGTVLNDADNRGESHAELAKNGGGQTGHRGTQYKNRK